MRFFMIWEVSALSLDVLTHTQTSMKYKPTQPIATSARWMGDLERGELCGLIGRARKWKSALQTISKRNSSTEILQRPSP